MKTMLHADDLSLRFGKVVPFDSVSFDIAEGELFAIIGPNGAGKTSLFNTLSRVYNPHRGALSLDGEDLLRLRPRDLASRGVARTFQNLSLFGHMSVLENVLVGRHHLMASGPLSAGVWFGRTGREERTHRSTVRAWIDRLGLSSVAHLPAVSLSYGQQKRVELARALAMEPRVLLLDEPVAGVSRAERAELAGLINEVRTETGLTVILVEHDMNLVMSLADRVLALDFGRVIAVGTPAEIQANHAVIDAYLGEHHAP